MLHASSRRDAAPVQGAAHAENRKFYMRNINVNSANTDQQPGHALAAVYALPLGTA
jgi:hypothetical protein